MTKILIFYPLNDDSARLLKDSVVLKLTDLFSGLTVFSGCSGYWINPKTELIERDNIEVFLILTENKFPSEDTEKLNALRKILAEIKTVLKQNCIAYSIDNRIYFL